MGLDIKQQGEVLIVKVYGEFDLHGADDARRDIDGFIKAREVKHVVFDLAQLTFIDSSGLGVILGRYRKVSENGGRVAITGVPPAIHRVMEIAGLTRLMPFFPDCSSALREIG